jgi:hypothetical protein
MLRLKDSAAVIEWRISMRRATTFAVVSFCSLLVAVEVTAQSTTAPSDSGNTSPSTQPAPPVHRSIWRGDNNDVLIGDSTHQMQSEIPPARFDFDVKKKSCAPAASILPARMPGSGDPVLPIIMYMSDASACFQYTNVLLDYGAATKDGFPKVCIGRVVTGDTLNQCAVIALTPGTSGKLYISPDFVIYDGGPPAKDAQDSRFASVNFSLASPAAYPNDATLVVVRNGTELKRIKMADIEKEKIDLEHVKSSDDVLRWSVESGGKTTSSGVVAFPVAGTAPGLVEYRVFLGNGK